MAKWGVVEERDDGGRFIAYHVMPMIEVDGESLVSVAHDSNASCSCGPFAEQCGDLNAAAGERREDGKYKRWIMFQHHDPEHEGALSEDEWLERKIKANKQ